jgi:hypothetical protein
MRTPRDVDWAVVAEANGVVFRWGHSGDDVVAEWAGVLSLRATRAGELKAVHPAPGASDDLVEKTRAGVAAAFLRALKRQHALHASAVAWQGKALVCVGGSGLGKSTMADRMCRRPGVHLLADDTTAIEVAANRVHVLPSESAIWLAKDGSNTKQPVRSFDVAKSPAALVCIVSLAFDDAAGSPKLRDIRGGDAVSALLPSLVRFEKTSALWARELDFLGAIVSHSRIVQATRSHDVPADAMADELLGVLTRKCT